MSNTRLTRENLSPFLSIVTHRYHCRQYAPSPASYTGTDRATLALVKPYAPLSSKQKPISRQPPSESKRDGNGLRLGLSVHIVGYDGSVSDEHASSSLAIVHSMLPRPEFRVTQRSNGTVYGMLYAYSSHCTLRFLENQDDALLNSHGCVVEIQPHRLCICSKLRYKYVSATVDRKGAKD